MTKDGSNKYAFNHKKVIHKSGGHAVWFLGFIGALVYNLHIHAGTTWLVVLAVLKSLVWPAYLVYHLMLFLKV
jgi:hypothetical protein